MNFVCYSLNARSRSLQKSVEINAVVFRSVRSDLEIPLALELPLNFSALIISTTARRRGIIESRSFVKYFPPCWVILFVYLNHDYKIEMKCIAVMKNRMKRRYR